MTLNLKQWRDSSVARDKAQPIKVDTSIPLELMIYPSDYHMMVYTSYDICVQLLLFSVQYYVMNFVNCSKHLL